MGQTREQKIIKQVVGVPTTQKFTPIATDMFLPNHSGISSHPEFKSVLDNYIKTDGTSTTTAEIPFAVGFDCEDIGYFTKTPQGLTSTNSSLVINPSGVMASPTAYLWIGNNDTNLFLVEETGQTTLQGRLIIKQTPTGKTSTNSSLIVNPILSSANSDLLWLGVNDGAVFEVDMDGDTTLFTLNLTASSGQIIFDSTSAIKTTLQDSAASSSKTVTLPNFTGTLATIGNFAQTFSGACTFSQDITISNTTPSLFLTDTTTSSDDYSINVDGSSFSIKNETDSTTSFSVTGTGGITLNAGADKTINIQDQNNFVFGGGMGTGTKFGTATGQKMGFWNATPVAQPSAFTQTYSTASKTHSNPTAATVTDTNGTAGFNLAADRTAVVTAVNNLIADVANVKQVLNALIDDLQSEGLIS